MTLPAAAQMAVKAALLIPAQFPMMQQVAVLMVAKASPMPVAVPLIAASSLMMHPVPLFPALPPLPESVTLTPVVLLPTTLAAAC